MFERKHLLLAIIVIGSALGIGTYFAYNSSTEFFKGQIIPDTGAFEITQPSADETNVSITPIIKWTPVTDATQYYITILHETGAEPVRDATVTDNNFTLPLSSALSYQTRYSVIVEATDTKGDKFTASQWFTTESDPTPLGIESITILEPLAGAENVSIMPKIGWSLVNGADSYTVNVSSADPEATSITVNTTATSLQVNAVNSLSLLTLYTIEVNALDIAGNVITSGSSNFVTREELNTEFRLTTASNEIIDGLPVVDTSLCLQRPTELTATDQIPQHPKCNIVTFSATPLNFDVKASEAYISYIPDSNNPGNFRLVNLVRTNTSNLGHTERVTWDGITCGTYKNVPTSSGIMKTKTENFTCPTNTKYFADFYLVDRLSGDIIRSYTEFYLKGN